MRKGYVDIPEGQVHYHEAGSEEPCVVLLHQTALSAKTYDPLLASGTLENRCIALDTPGFGGSFDPPGWPSLETYADQAIAAFTRLCPSPVHLFGHHTGASLAIEIAARAPDRVASLILAGPVFMTQAEREDFIAGYKDPITPRRGGEHLMRNWDYAASHNPDCDIAILQDAVVDLLRAWRGRPQAYMAVAHHDTEARAKKVAAPVLLMTTPGDFFHASFDRAKALFPGARLAQTGGDNFPAASDPEGVAAAVRAFLEALDED
ncbi:hypothetical protein B2G71_17545 [Novosphingobium sp. PC22D]|nr:hypothetical protein B2G71_17545 [Novosphingobium sp. PC22D]